MRIFSCFILIFFVFIGALITHFPLKFFVQLASLEARGVSFDRAVGTIWNGGLSDVRISGESIGQLNMSLKPVSVIQLKPQINFEFSGAIGSGKGKLVLSADRSAQISDVIADIQLNAFQHLDAQLRHSPSKLKLSISEIKLNALGECIVASGSMSSDLLTSVGLSWGWDGPNIEGKIACEGEAFLLTLGNHTGADKIDARGIVRADLSYDVQSQVRTFNDGLANALISFGFQAQPEAGLFEYTKLMQKNEN